MPTVSLEGLTKVYPNGVRAVSDLSLTVDDGEFVVLVGPSGCGKTTALRMVAGLEEITSGTLRVGDRVVNNVSPRARDVAMVFQNYALYPHLSVQQNIGFSLENRKVPKAERAARVRAAAAILGLTEVLDRKPRQLSGGQRQRVAMGRAIVREPTIFLMDEPLSNLDAKLRVQMRSEVLRVQRRIGAATLYVTHDQTEAMTMGDRVAVMRDGELQQVSTPRELYEHPANTFVATFIGSPSMNLYGAALQATGESAAVALGGQRLALPPAFVTPGSPLAKYVGCPVVVGIRPEHLSDPEVSGRIPSAGKSLRARVELVEVLGSELHVHFSFGGRSLGEHGQFRDSAGGATGADAMAAQEADAVARIDSRSRLKAGQQATLAVDVEQLHFFDPENGAALAVNAEAS
jgi:multiple sugar transport system ATP-binding protein